MAIAKTVVDIKTDVEDELIWDSRVLSTNVNVDVDSNGKVTLTGNVPFASARRAAAESAWSVAGVSDVENEIDVIYPKTVVIPNDTDIKNSVDRSLLWNSSLNSTKIEATVNAGEVTLEGTVDTMWKKTLAENITSDVLGVTSVVNKLAVVPTKAVVDEEIATDIVEAMDRRAIVDSEDVTVKVDNGNVTISGTVPNFSAWSAAYNSAFHTLGVKDIRDDLKIE